MDPTASDSSLQKTSPNQDPAVLTQLTSEVSAQASMLAAHHQQLQKLTSLTEELVRTLQTLHVTNPPTNATPPVPSPPPITPTMPPTSQRPRLSLPDKYDGSPERCKGFLMQCYLYIHQQPLTFPTDASQVSFICSLLTGRALDWATAIWEGNRLSFPTYDTFIRQFREVFEHSASGKEVGEELIALRQGSSTAADYTLTFRTLAAQTGWENEPLRLLYRKGLNEELQSELACRDEGRTLEQFMELTIRIDNLMRSRRVHRSALPIPTNQRIPEPEPMQVGVTRLSAEERERRIRQHLCLYCGESGHLRAACTARPARRVHTLVSADHNPTNSFEIPITITNNNESTATMAMIDSGVAGNFYWYFICQCSQSPSCSMWISGSGGSIRWKTAGIWEDQLPDSRTTSSNRYPTHRIHKIVCHWISTESCHPGPAMAGETQSPDFMVITTDSSMVRVLSPSLPNFKPQVFRSFQGGEAREQGPLRITCRISGPVWGLQ